ncbi:hypothetical protein CEXT_552501 [Caerostris extrusa]|uniref:Uncharacterized protein n=1 Tax=Caerostris extrusa TaxID=172846 RepID=A0AAV4YDI8_CAEEX|nr:hypothetical protein CEXT_552501 [Caerostris extrusa]
MCQLSWGACCRSLWSRTCHYANPFPMNHGCNDQILDCVWCAECNYHSKRGLEAQTYDRLGWKHTVSLHAIIHNLADKNLPFSSSNEKYRNQPRSSLCQICVGAGSEIKFLQLSPYFSLRMLGSHSKIENEKETACAIHGYVQ